MKMKMWPLLVLAFLPVAARGQESIRNLTMPQNSKFLTPGQLDRWIFDGEKGETIIAHIVTKEFDPVLGLAKAGAKNIDKVLLQVDDPGSESRFSIRLPEKGRYKIRIHAFKYQGGGNYTLVVKGFQAIPLTVGKLVIGNFDHQGKSYHYFRAAKQPILIPMLKGTAPGAWEILDSRGRPLHDWAGSVLIKNEGECHLVLSGKADYRYDLLVREAKRHDLAQGKQPARELARGELDVWSFEGKPGDFRLLEVEKKGELQSRLIFAPAKENDEQIAQLESRPAIRFLPVASRGGHLRFAAILGREGKYQLQLMGETPASYRVSLRDPSVPIDWDKETLGNLPVGGAAFFSFRAKPGQLVQAALVTKTFVPVLRLYDGHGKLIRRRGDDSDALESHITHMVVKEGLYRMQVSSLGDGGGGDFRLSLEETKLKELKLGERAQGKVRAGAIDFWTFTAKQGQIIFLNVRSSSFHPMVTVYSSDGVHLAADDKGNATTGSLLALKLPRTGRYTIWIASHRGAGPYQVRLIAGD